MQAPPPWFPGHVSLSNFINVWGTIPLARYMLNTAFVAAVTTVISVTISALSGYALCRLNFFGNTAVFVLILFTQAIPTVIILVPLYMLLNNFGLLNSRVGLSLSYIVWSVPFCTPAAAQLFQDGVPS